MSWQALISLSCLVHTYSTPPPGAQTMTIYQQQGYENRRDYLNNLADDLGIERSTVYALAQMLGPSEDFDGLVTSLEDYADGY
jgi:hypothetical protein